jgi:hypothetical protein
MPIPTILRRLRKVEAALALALMPDYPPFTRSEIAEIERRARAGENLTRAEVQRVEQHRPIIDGELMITSHRGARIR